MKKVFALLIALMLLCASLPATMAEEPSTGGTLSLGIHITPASMWPNRDNGGVYWLSYVAEQLAYYDSYTGQMVYQLATDMKEDFDNKTITVTLRDGVTFHDGSPFNADAAIWNLQVYMDNNPMAIGSPASVEKIDDLSFVVHYNEMTLQSINSLGLAWMLSKEYYDKNGEDCYVTNLVGTGPFVQTEYITDDHWTYERNENYWGARPYLDKIIVHRITDRQALITSFVNGDIDMVYTGNESYLKTLESYGFAPDFQTATASNVFACPNVKAEGSPWADENVRKAVFLYGIDFDALAYGCAGNFAKHYYTYSFDYDWHHDPAAGESLYDMDKAKQMLADAGYPNGFSTTIYVESRYPNEAAGLQASLKMLGIDAEVVFTDEVYNLRDQGEVEGLILFGCQTNVNNYGHFVSYWGKDGWSTGILKYDDQLIALEDAATQAATIEERNEALKAWAHALAYDYVYVIPIDFVPEYYFTQSYVHGFKEAFHGTAVYNEELIWVDAH